MKAQVIIPACCKVLGLLFIYQGYTRLVSGLTYWWYVSNFPPGVPQFAYAGLFLAALAFFVAAFFAIGHSNQIAFHLVGDLDSAEESAAYSQERDFWAQLAYVLFAFYLIVHATADAGTEVAALVSKSLRPNLNGGVVSSFVLVVAGVILLRRAHPRLKKLAAPRAREGEE